MAVKTYLVSSALMIAATQSVQAHQLLSPHIHPSDGALYISWLEIAAILSAAGMAFAFVRYLHGQSKKAKARRK